MSASKPTLDPTRDIAQSFSFINSSQRASKPIAPSISNSDTSITNSVAHKQLINLTEQQQRRLSILSRTETPSPTARTVESPKIDFQTANCGRNALHWAAAEGKKDAVWLFSKNKKFPPR